jgi:hypothetical protein
MQLVPYRFRERGYDSVWMIEDDIGKKAYLWRWVALEDVAIREVRVWAGHGIHVCALDWTVYLLLPLLAAL